MPGYGSRGAPAGLCGVCAAAVVLCRGARAADQSARRLQAHRGGGARGGGEAGCAATAGRGPNRVLTKCFREPQKLVGVIEDMRKTLCFRSFFSPTARR